MFSSWTGLLTWLPAQLGCRMCFEAAGHLWPAFLKGWIYKLCSVVEQECKFAPLPRMAIGCDLQLLGSCGHTSQWDRTEGSAKQLGRTISLLSSLGGLQHVLHNWYGPLARDPNQAELLTKLSGQKGPPAQLCR